jgi:DinB superfamily
MKTLSAELISFIDSADVALRKVSEENSGKPALPGGWSRKQVLGHLLDSASNNHQRFVRAALQDSLEFPSYDQDGWVRVEAVQGVPWPTLITLWANYNRYLAHVIAHLPPGKLEVACKIGSNKPVTLAFLVEDYVRHLAHHLAQIGLKQ